MGQAAVRERGSGATELTDSSSGASDGQGSVNPPQSQRKQRAQQRGQLTAPAAVPFAATAVRVPLSAAQSAANAQRQKARDQATARCQRTARRAAAKVAQRAARSRAKRKKQAQSDQQNLVAAGLPSHWEPVDPSHGNSTLVLLDPVNKPHHAAELAKVKQNFAATGGVGTIRSVHRIQNAHLHRQYETAKAAMQQSATSAASLLVDHVVYHGTRWNPPHLIHASTKGFDPALGTAMPGHVWFAQHAAYSSTSYGHPVQQARMPFGSKTAFQYQNLDAPTYPGIFKQILQARITVPQPPPAAPFARPGPGIFVVPRSERCYPEYLITFQ